MKNNSIMRFWKDPLYRMNLSSDERGNMPGSPVGDSLEEIQGNELLNAVGAGDVQANTSTVQILTPKTPIISNTLGNKGHACTITKECQNMCN
ncbi:plantaricin C family lantibiotic [Bacillus cereus]|uniref:plantaricin C family lantibiotic n=1 Tax=Bacillus cereus group sp. BfR-BA-01347 TaxID=2920310 RepID=UPI001F594738|nr:plantaricin C family lantibiotic [Bacillus cereus group sp. BfR-BA-01347]MCU5274275.1 plantaricin C family lantibiotic [Bacillus cereus]